MRKFPNDNKLGIYVVVLAIYSIMSMRIKMMFNNFKMVQFLSLNSESLSNIISSCFLMECSFSHQKYRKSLVSFVAEKWSYAILYLWPRPLIGDHQTSTLRGEGNFKTAYHKKVNWWMHLMIHADSVGRERVRATAKNRRYYFKW